MCVPTLSYSLLGKSLHHKIFIYFIWFNSQFHLYLTTLLIVPSVWEFGIHKSCSRLMIFGKFGKEEVHICNVVKSMADGGSLTLGSTNVTSTVVCTPSFFHLLSLFFTYRPNRTTRRIIKIVLISWPYLYT